MNSTENITTSDRREDAQSSGWMDRLKGLFRREQTAKVVPQAEVPPLFGDPKRESWVKAEELLKKAKESYSQEKKTQGVSQTFTIRMPFVRRESGFHNEMIPFHSQKIQTDFDTFTFLESMGYEDITDEMISDAEKTLAEIKGLLSPDEAAAYNIGIVRLEKMLEAGKEKRARFIAQDGAQHAGSQVQPF